MSRTAKKQARRPTGARNGSSGARTNRSSPGGTPASADAVNDASNVVAADRVKVDGKSAAERSADDRESIAAAEVAEADEAILRLLAEHQARLSNSNWDLCGLDLGREHQRMAKWASQIKDELMPTEWESVRLKWPRVMRLTFAIHSPNVLGSYMFGRSADGLPYTMNMNPLAMVSRTDAQNAQTIAHELFHMAQDLHRQILGRPISRGASHDVEFRRQAEQLGIPCTSRGYELGLVPRSKMDQWLMHNNVSREHEYVIVMKKGRKGTGRIVRREI